MSYVRVQNHCGPGENNMCPGYDPRSYPTAAGNTTFNGGVTGLGLADYMLGVPQSFVVGTPTGAKMRSNYIGIYAQDNWRLSSNVRLNAGLRWDPYFPAYSGPGQVTRFDRARFDAR